LIWIWPEPLVAVGWPRVRRALGTRMRVTEWKWLWGRESLCFWNQRCPSCRYAPGPYTEIYWIQHEISASFHVEISQFFSWLFWLPWHGVFQHNQILETPTYRATLIFLCW
jgi:hypothetical protein